MTRTTDRVFGNHDEALLLRARRGELLASNLANADTPHFKARDFDFHAALRQATAADALTPRPDVGAQTTWMPVTAEERARLSSAPTLAAPSLASSAMGGAGVKAASTLSQTHPGHLSQVEAGSVDGTELPYRVPFQPALDGNTVESEHEKLRFMENSVAYQTTLSFLNSRISSVMRALQGDKG